MNYKDLYKQVTQDILASLKEGVAPWTKPWTTNSVGGYLPMNASTSLRYRGINVPILWNAAIKNRFPSHSWLTFRQATELGGFVKKGAKSTTVVFTKWIVKEEDGKETKRPMMRTYSVFNVEQCENLPAHVLPSPITSTIEEAYENVETFFKGTGAELVIGGEKACYIPSEDYIKMPDRTTFEDTASYYSTLLHELTHWSGHKERLNRALCGQFKSKDYAFEELVAELGSAMLCANLGVVGKLQHAEYIQSWIKVLENDHRAFFKASSYASQACDMIIEQAEHADLAA